MSTPNRTPPIYMRREACFLLGVVFALCLGLVGKSDYEQKVADVEYTCDMIKARAWPSAVRPACKHEAREAEQAPQQLAKL